MKEDTLRGARVRASTIGFIVVAILISVAHALSQDRDNGQSFGKDRKIMHLLRILRDEQLRQVEPERVIEAIEQIGDLKSIAAIDDLAQLLTFGRNVEPETMGDVIVGEHFITTFARYPAARALFRIGKPALPALIKVIAAEETGSPASENATYTVTQIFRDAPSDGVEYLRSAAGKASSNQEVQRLSVAAEKLKGFLQQ
jgi:HEAT repeat protein